MITQGRRIEHLDHTANGGIEPGDYWKDSRGHWNVAAPVPCDDGSVMIKDISALEVTEHKEGAITVGSSISWDVEVKSATARKRVAKPAWHGFLERGMWRLA